MLKVENLNQRFDDLVLMDNFSLEVKKGEKIAIIGPSGCGKSTLLRFILRLKKPDSGKIWFEGREITEMDAYELSQLRLKFGMLFQSAALFDSLNVRDNVGFSLFENYQYSEDHVCGRVNEVIELVGMSKYRDAWPDKLSGGQRKRIGLARAIAASPEVVLYDEPTTGLDPILSTSIEDLIVDLNNKLNMTSIVVSHQKSTILRTADKIYMMHQGKLLEPETPATIGTSKNPIIRQFIEGSLVS